MTHSVEVQINEDHEGITIHKWLMDQSRHKVAVWHKDGDGPQVPVTEYHSRAGYSETLIAYCICEAWLNHFDLLYQSLRFEFDDLSEALMFKLTFGGA